jgi:hypothetical protein
LQYSGTVTVLFKTFELIRTGSLRDNQSNTQSNNLFMSNDLITFEQLRLIAVKNNVPDNKTEIGIWAKNNGYYQMKKRKDNKVRIYYYKQ